MTITFDAELTERMITFGADLTINPTFDTMTTRLNPSHTDLIISKKEGVR